MAQQVNRRLGAMEAFKVRQLVDRLLSSSLPCTPLRNLAARASSPQAEPFERYAGLVLRDAGAQKLADIPLAHALKLNPPAAGKLARFSYAGTLSAPELETLQHTENALNRLVGIADAIDDSVIDTLVGGDKQRIGISPLGVDYLPHQAGYRSALVKLPQVSPLKRATTEYFCEVDWRVTDHVASNARAVFQSCITPNILQSIVGVHSPDGSDWDIRTRMAAIMESLELPFRLQYVFDCDVQRKAVGVKITAPDTSCLPSLVVDAKTGRITPIGEASALSQDVYLLRLACLLGAACFGAGKHVQKAYVTIADGSEDTLLACVFERDAYVRNVLVRIDNHELANHGLRFDPDRLIQLISPEQLYFNRRSHTAYTQPGLHPQGVDGKQERSEALRITGFASDAEPSQRIEPSEDVRPLPEPLKDVLRAHRICDIDTKSYFGGYIEAVEEAKLDADSAPLAAIARLEQLVSQLEEACIPPADDESSRPLYCAHALARLGLALINDELSVGTQAEEFLLHASSEDTEETPPQPWFYFRAPHALYNAHLGLSDLYQRIGDFRGAEAQADRCISLAPTSAGSYFRKADVLAEQQRFVEAANVLVSGLRCAVSKRDCALLYYHLALILWNIGQQRDAAAVYVYAASLAGEFAEKAARVVEGLRKRDEIPVIIYASPLAAAREMSRARIPIAPSDAALHLIAKTTIELANAGAPEAAAPYAAALKDYLPPDPAIAAACHSIQFGLQHIRFSDPA